MVLAVVKAYVALWALLLMAGMSARSILSFFLYAALCFLFVEEEKHKKVSRPWVLRISAAIYTAFTALALQGQISAGFDSRLFAAGMMLILIVGWYLFAHALLVVLTTLLSGDGVFRFLRRDPADDGCSDLFGRHLFLFSFLICCAFYLPWFLYSYPGIFSPDPINQAEQFLGLEPWSNHHPVAHTLLMGLFYRLGMMLTGDITSSLALYTLFQMLLLAFTGAFVVSTLDRVFCFRRMICVFVLVFYAVYPFMPIMSVIVGKDTPFSSVVTLFSCVLVRIWHDGLKQQGAGRWGLTAAFWGLGLSVCLLRSNGFYAFILTAVFFVILFRRDLKRALLMVLPVIAAAVVIKGPVMNASQVRQPDMIESLCVPLQQVTQVLVNDRELSDADRELISSVIDTTYIKELYVPGFADNMKELVRAGNEEYLVEHKWEFLSLWIRLGLRYPGDYLAAYGAQVRGFIYPDYTGDVLVIEGVYSNGIGLEYRPLIGGSILVKLRELVIKLGSYVPLDSVLWCMGFYAWALLFTITLILSQGRDRGRLLILLPVLTIWLTYLVATPINDEYRYAFPLVTAFPLMLCALVRKTGQASEDSEKPAGNLKESG
ncbi:MAG: DUF6020 family protein [Lachnospiraceae bacterium]|nr:DUF6020 family protein [Lachnospiraceae bacterium]